MFACAAKGEPRSAKLAPHERSMKSNDLFALPEKNPAILGRRSFGL
jgi:hypothetical protein